MMKLLDKTKKRDLILFAKNLLIFFGYIGGILLVAYVYREISPFFHDLEQIAKEREYYSQISWAFSGLILAVAFAMVLIGVQRAKSETIKSLFWSYIEYICYYVVFLVALDFYYWLATDIFQISFL